MVLSENRCILKCNDCNMTLALGEIIEQVQMNFCVFANRCKIYNPFTKKLRTRIFCREYKEIKAVNFCRLLCEYRTPYV
jgi:hypothetical protein